MAKRRSSFHTSHHFNRTVCLMEKFIAIGTHYLLCECEASVSFQSTFGSARFGFEESRNGRTDSNLHTKLQLITSWIFYIARGFLIDIRSVCIGCVILCALCSRMLCYQDRVQFVNCKIKQHEANEVIKVTQKPWKDVLHFPLPPSQHTYSMWFNMSYSCMLSTGFQKKKN